MRKPKIQRLHIRLLKGSVSRLESCVQRPRSLQTYRLKGDLPFKGRLYVAPPRRGTPPWLEFVQTGTRDRLKDLMNRTNAAVLLMEVAGRYFACTFGHGRHLLKPGVVEPEFGVKTALNSLRSDSLRSVDTLVLEDQAMHRRAQASRSSGIEAFGLDVSRDILRAVTGLPRPGVGFVSISGSEEAVAVSARTSFRGLGDLCNELCRLHSGTDYRRDFAWVDHVRRVRDPTVVKNLQDLLLTDLRSKTPKAVLVPPEPLDWERTDGFAYTRRKRALDADVGLEAYLGTLSARVLDLDRLRADKVLHFSDGASQPGRQWPVYKCVLFEAKDGSRAYILSAGAWYEVEPIFAKRIRRTVGGIPFSSLALPGVRKIADGKLEHERTYNGRVAGASRGLALLDRKLARCRMASTRIEVCDLLSRDGHLVHVKHKRDSSALSHLFAQGRVSAEAILSDDDFRADARRHLRTISSAWQRMIPPKRPNPSRYTVVFAFLGVESKELLPWMPFFSQLNLARTYTDLTGRGFRVELLGVPVDDSD